MSWTYSCPHCAQVLNPDETVILIGYINRQEVLVGFHPQPGNYTAYLPPGVELQHGTSYDFFCPLCRTNLESQSHENLCELVIWYGHERRRLLFSRNAGEHATYVVRATPTPAAPQEQIAERHGEHTGRYDNTLTFVRPPGL